MQGKTGADDGTEAGDADGGGGQGNGGGENAVALELLPLPQVNIVDFASIHINERATRKVGTPSLCLLELVVLDKKKRVVGFGFGP